MCIVSQPPLKIHSHETSLKIENHETSSSELLAFAFPLLLAVAAEEKGHVGVAGLPRAPSALQLAATVLA